MKIWATMIAAASLLAAQEAPRAAAPQTGRVIGEVKAKEANKLTVKADSGETYAVSLQESTAFLRIPPGEKDLKNASKIAAGDVNVGDRVLAQGKLDEAQKAMPALRVIVMTRSDLEQKQAKERAAWQQRGSGGMVAEVTPSAVVITSKVRGESKKVELAVSDKTRYRRYAPDSVRFVDAQPSKLSEIKPGDQLRVLGDKNEDGSKITAEEIVFGTFRSIPATVLSVDATTGELKVTDLDTKKQLIVLVTPDTQVRKLPEMMARMLAMQVNGAAAGGFAGMGQGARGGMAAGGATAAPGQGQQRPQGAPAGAAAAGGQRAPGGPGGFPGGAGGFPGGPGGARGGDLSSMLERLPAFSLAELKPGEPLIISSTAAAGSARVSAITVLAGVEPILTSAPRSAGNINLGTWNMEMSIPQ